MPSFWDEMSPFYRRLPTPPPFATEVTADQVGIGLVAAVTGLSVAHGVASYVRHRRQAAAEAGAGGETGTAAPAISEAVAVAEPPPTPESTESPTPPGAAADEEGMDR
jgi:hypothetical protein